MSNLYTTGISHAHADTNGYTNKDTFANEHSITPAPVTPNASTHEHLSTHNYSHATTYLHPATYTNAHFVADTNTNQHAKTLNRALCAGSVSQLKFEIATNSQRIPHIAQCGFIALPLGTHFHPQFQKYFGV